MDRLQAIRARKKPSQTAGPFKITGNALRSMLAAAVNSIRWFRRTYELLGEIAVKARDFLHLNHEASHPDFANSVRFVKPAGID